MPNEREFSIKGPNKLLVSGFMAEKNHVGRSDFFFWKTGPVHVEDNR